MACRGSSLSRRSFLAAGAVGGLGISLGDFFAMQKAYADTNKVATLQAKAKSVIHIYLPGGISAQETFDPKPYAPIEYRGELKAISTKVPGVQFCETMRRTANIADKMTIIRSLTHSEAAHERGTHNMFTGYQPSPALQHPCMGSVVSHELGSRNYLPPYVCIPNQPNPSASSGYLSASFAPFGLGDDPARKGFRVRDLTLPKGMNQERFARRVAALETVNAQFAKNSSSDPVIAMNSFYERAFDLIGSQKAQEAFQIEKEPAKLRDQYGRTQPGQRMLMARRLVEAGVRFVTLTYGGWDHHEQITRRMREKAPSLDQALASLITDLDERGMLDETLVMVTSEFGRTPKINKNAGRDHWARVFSVALAGGGIKRGAVVGASNAVGAEPERNPISPADLACTVYHQLGINAEKELYAPGARPIEIVNGGRVCKELLA